jgi:LytS/YehU family sensor histidine kinase
MAHDSLIYLLGATTLVFGGLFLRARSVLKKQRKVTNELVKKREALISERDTLIHKLELESLKFQVSPHSLRNTLNVVKYYTETSNMAIGRLTNVLDFLLYESTADSISLKDELKFIKNFHDLMKIRTSELVITKFYENLSQHPKVETLRVPPMITAYYLENAYKHGELAREGMININLTLEEDELVYTVENTIRSSAPGELQKGGIGLNNMRRRLDILYKDRYSENCRQEDNIYIAELRIKL